MEITNGQAWQNYSQNSVFIERSQVPWPGSLISAHKYKKKLKVSLDLQIVFEDLFDLFDKYIIH